MIDSYINRLGKVVDNYDTRTIVNLFELLELRYIEDLSKGLFYVIVDMSRKLT